MVQDIILFKGQLYERNKIEYDVVLQVYLLYTYDNRAVVEGYERREVCSVCLKSALLNRFHETHLLFH